MSAELCNGPAEHRLDPRVGPRRERNVFALGAVPADGVWCTSGHSSSIGPLYMLRGSLAKALDCARSVDGLGGGVERGTVAREGYVVATVYGPRARQ